jgi:ABC-type transport system involved in Fe-S cluster assembly fused permease/ATPase subunit
VDVSHATSLSAPPPHTTSQDAYRRVSLRVFSHVLDLDLGFHLGRKTGEVTKQVGV